jgi:hypothetical protein
MSDIPVPLGIDRGRIRMSALQLLCLTEFLAREGAERATLAAWNQKTILGGNRPQTPGMKLHPGGHPDLLPCPSATPPPFCEHSL